MTVSEFFDAFEEAVAARSLPWRAHRDPETQQVMLRAYDVKATEHGYRCFCPVMAVIHHRDPESDIVVSSSQGDMAGKLGMAVRDMADIMQAADEDRVVDTDGETVNLFDPSYRAKLLKIAGVEEVPCA